MNTATETLAQECLNEKIAEAVMQYIKTVQAMPEGEMRTFSTFEFNVSLIAYQVNKHRTISVNTKIHETT